MLPMLPVVFYLGITAIKKSLITDDLFKQV